MEWVEITSRTVQEATEQALDTLGVDEADAEVQVVEEPQPGLFGRTRGKARVRARVVPKQHPPKQERRDRKRSPRGAKGRDDAPAAPSDEGGSAPAEADAPAADDSSTDSGSSGPRRRRRSRGGQGGGRDSGARGDRDTGREAEQGDSVEPTLTLDEHVEAVETFVRGLVDAFGAEATIEVAEIDDETREVQVIGSDLGLLIGPRGQTLQAVHELARTVVFRAAPGGQDGRVRIDIGGYRERRRQALEQFSAKIGEEVAASGTARALEPMSPPDRKVVHDTINGIDGVRTTSEGEEPRRRVVVLPDT
ncbi:KH domain-containing protein [Iamia sp. SCSIO 61187]|uniref:RNA-binding cell elongation regulator Jag/EloR n=1 Tax=Iamia sp. SCSIO 61187 TaxID=2722752 RepID=UPI001C637731|nr:RNA-binding cell elongation regulator Jag/EloR [Iamia sp. SCSIO 61187]QYG95306.1 KH domain-containing protein [Iamia sp. SCSIO 61187]